MTDRIQDLQRWKDDGTLGRIAEASDTRTPVKIRRTSGEVQDALLASTCGFGGLMCVVAWHDDDISKTEFTRDVGGDMVYPVNGTRLKSVDTHDLVDLNPWLLA